MCNGRGGVLQFVETVNAAGVVFGPPGTNGIGTNPQVREGIPAGAELVSLYAWGGASDDFSFSIGTGTQSERSRSPSSAAANIALGTLPEGIPAVVVIWTESGGGSATISGLIGWRCRCRCSKGGGCGG